MTESRAVGGGYAWSTKYGEKREEQLEEKQRSETRERGGEEHKEEESWRREHSIVLRPLISPSLSHCMCQSDQGRQA